MGHSNVGYAEMDYISPTRSEKYTKSNEPRKLLFHFYFPTDSNDYVLGHSKVDVETIYRIMSERVVFLLSFWKMVY